MILPRASLLIAGILFAAVGLVFLVDPARFGSVVDFDLRRPRQAIEIRAMYGGLCTGLGTFFLVAMNRTRWIRAALAAQVASFASLAAGRVVGMAASGPDGLMTVLAAVEVGGAVLGLVAFRRARQAFLASRADAERLAG